MLNSKELIDRKIITNVPPENVAQHGIDLSVIKIEKIDGMGEVLKTGTVLADYQNVVPVDNKWALVPGIYSVTFDQGCNIPPDQMLLIRQRSSMLRNGATLQSSVFDAGFKTNNIGTVMVVFIPILIEVGARIAQIYNHICTPVENLYDGQFQNDKQRKG